MSHHDKHGVAVVVNGLLGGGAERVALEHAKWLVGQGHRVLLVTMDASGRHVPSDELREEVALSGVSLKSAEARVFRRLPVMSTLERAARLWRQMRQFGTRHTFSHLPRASFIAWLVAGRSAVPVVHSVLSERYGALGRMLSARTYLKAGAMAVSPAVRDDLIQNFRIGQPVWFVPNPVRADIVSLSLTGGDEGWPAGRNIAFLGRLHPAKRIDLLIRAFARVADRFDHLVIIGEGAELPRLKDVAASTGLAHRIHFLGHRQNPYGCIRQAAILVLPSIKEGYGLVLAEALVLGVPVAAFASAGGPQCILSGRLSKYLLGPGTENERDLAVAIEVNSRQPVLAEDLHRSVFSHESFHAMLTDCMDHIDRGAGRP